MSLVTNWPLLLCNSCLNDTLIEFAENVNSFMTFTSHILTLGFIKPVNV